MNTRNQIYSDLASMKGWLSFYILMFLLAATLPYSWLIAHFGYDDILREPTEKILTTFHAGGAALVLAWFAFAMSALMFIPVAMGFSRLLSRLHASKWDASNLGVASAIVQAAGLLRWVLVVPGLAAAFVAPNTSAIQRDTLVIAFDIVHRFGGMLLGEMLGQLLLAAWTTLVSIQLYRSRAVSHWISIVGMATIPLWLLGQTELLHEVIPALPSIEVIPIAFMAWEVWLMLLAVSFGFSAWKARRIT